ncbi:beta-adaptin A, partial [Haematococcus lacustris]
MASGGQPPTYKYYFYGQDTSGSWLLVEMVVHTQQLSADVVI